MLFFFFKAEDGIRDDLVTGVQTCALPIYGTSDFSALNSNVPSWKGSPMATMEAPPRLQLRLHEGAFKNEPFVDFSKEENVRKMRAAIEKEPGQLGREYDLIIGGKRAKTSDKIRSINPAKPSQVVGIHQKAGQEHVDPPVHAALKAFSNWSRSSVEERTSLLFRVAEVMRERNLEYM